VYYEGGDLKKAMLHYVAAAMAGQKSKRSRILGTIEAQSGNMGYGTSFEALDNCSINWELYCHV
jgi:hypothetical protein